jgi:predicted permease
MAKFLKDLLRALRALSRDRTVNTFAVSILALGIGANTTIFSLLNAVVLRSLPVPNPEQVVALGTTISDNVNVQAFSLAMFNEMSSQQQTFSELFASNDSGINTFEVDGRYITAELAEVTGSYYRAMRIAPRLGRLIDARDVSVGSEMSSAVAVISYRAWRDWYHSDVNVIGKIIRVGNHHPFTIIGVHPEGFSGLIIDASPDVTIPILSTSQTGGISLRDPRILWLRLYGRLKPGVSIQQARTSVTTLWPHILEATAPPGYGGERLARFYARRITLDSAATGVSLLRKPFSYSLQILLALVGAVLLIACLNLANLTLARASARWHEACVRAALGASTWELVRPALIENVLLSCIGATIALPSAYWASQNLLHIAWTGLAPIALNPSLDVKVLTFATAATLVSGIVFTIPVAFHAVRVNPIEGLRRQTRSVHGGMGIGARLLLIAQMALSLVLVSGALLFAQTLKNLHDESVGYRRDHLLTLMLFPQPGSGGSQKATAYYKQLAEEVKQLPGVESVSFSYNGPANQVEDYTQVYSSLTAPPVDAVSEFAGPGFFRVMGMQVLTGREFDWHDEERGAEVAIVSDSLAKKLFGDGDPVGRTVYFGPHAHALPLKIVGVVNSASLWKVENPRPLAIYRKLGSLFPDTEPLLDIRTQIDPRKLKVEAERTVREMGRHYSLRTLTVEERLDSYLSVQRLTAHLTAFFGGLAVLISLIGLYGLMSFQIARRTAEMGIRLALGAQRERVLAMVLRETLALALVGCSLGLAVSVLSAKFISSMLFGVSPSDPAILAMAVGVHVGVAVAAGFVPARRAASIDPVVALRGE